MRSRKSTKKKMKKSGRQRWPKCWIICKKRSKINRGHSGSIRLAPDQTDRRRAPSSGLLGWRRSAAYAATTLRAASRARGQRPLPVCPSPASWEARPDRAQCSGVKATEVWIPDQTSGAQAPSFGGLLGPLARSAAYAATPPRFASRARGHRAHVVLGSRPKQRPSLLGLSARSALARDARARCASRARGQRPLPVCPSPASLVRQSGRALCSGVKATEVWIPDQTSGAQAPYFGGLLGPAVRSAAKAATPPQFALRARGQCPLPVCPSPASWEARPDRAQCSGVLRHSPGRAGVACLGKKQVGAGCDMRVPSTQPKAGTLPGDT